MKKIIALTLLQLFIANALNPVHIIENDASAPKDYVPSFPKQYDILAPFPAGSREIVDILDAFGGILSVPRNQSVQMPSDIIDGGFVDWFTVPTGANGVVTINFNESSVNWPLIEAWAGSAGSSFNGWALGDFTVEYDGSYALYCGGVMYFYVDNKDTIYAGDGYSANWLSATVFLNAGQHTLLVPFYGSEGAQFQCEFLEFSSELRIVSDFEYPDVVGTQLASPYFSLVLQNTMATQAIVDIQVSVTGLTITQQDNPTLLPGQTSPINFQVSTSDTITCTDNWYNITVTFSAPSVVSVSQNLSLHCKTFGSAFTFTFLDVDNSVQYAAATPPLESCPDTGCPVLFTFHGAGVDAASPGWTNSYKRQNNTWTLFPTNRRAYGWDWQDPGRYDAFAALDYLAANLPGVSSNLADNYGVDSNKVIYAGHSMGGHGCWHISSHFPDRALAVAPAAGWISMEFYTPYFTRVGFSLSSPFLKYILESSIAEHAADFYAPHLVGLPLIIRMGGDDTNVPPYHLRRMARLVDQLSADPTHTQVSEIPGQGHWFNGVVDDAIMQKFFDENFSETLPALPDKWTVVTLNPASSEGRGGIRILQLRLPYNEGKVQVVKSSAEWTLTTKNVRRLGFYSYPTLETPQNGIILDGQSFSDPLPSLPNHFCRLNTQWQICDGSYEQTERSPLTYGPAIQVIDGPLLFIYGTTAGNDIWRDQAVYLANRLYYQARYNVKLVADVEIDIADAEAYNIVLFGGPSQNSFTRQIAGGFPVKFGPNGFAIGDTQFSGLVNSSLLFLAPWNGTRLAVLMDGSDDIGAAQCALLFPTKSGVKIPDYIVAGPTWSWASDGGILAAGFWDNDWTFNPAIGYIGLF